MGISDPSSAREAGWRFRNVNIPNGARIVSAVIQVAADQSQSATSTVTLKGDFEDNCATFSTLADFDGRARTGSSVTWVLPGWTATSWYSSSDVSSIVQEIVNRPGWVSGNALAMFSSAAIGQSRKDVRTYDSAASWGAKLVVTYST
jgi:hypothetical protein